MRLDSEQLRSIVRRNFQLFHVTEKEAVEARARYHRNLYCEHVRPWLEEHLSPGEVFEPDDMEELAPYTVEERGEALRYGALEDEVDRIDGGRWRYCET